MDINEKITEIKLHIKNLVSHFPYTEEEINYLVIAYIALIMLDESISDLSGGREQPPIRFQQALV